MGADLQADILPAAKAQCQSTEQTLYMYLSNIQYILSSILQTVYL